MCATKDREGKRRGAGGSPVFRMYQHIKRGKRVVGEKELYFRSEAEYVLAMFFEQSGWQWEYEPQEFFFPVPRGVRFYRPDFRVVLPDETYKWVEVKGWLDKQSKTRLRRFAQYYPSEAARLVLVTDSRRQAEEFLAKLGEVGNQVEIWSLRRIKGVVGCS